MNNTPPAFLVENSDNDSPLLFVCDHASNALPPAYDQLGLDKQTLSQHIAWDIGALGIARKLSSRFQSTLVSGVYSRLLVDLNRFPGDPGWIPESSDGIAIPANQNLSESQRKARADRYFWPYQQAISREVEKINARTQTPIIISIHSFTPALTDGKQRPWHIGILWSDDDRLAAPMMTALRDNPAVCVGDNQPYHANNPKGYTVKTHAEDVDYLNLLVEIRQDLIGDEIGVDKWSEIFGDALERVLGCYQ